MATKVNTKSEKKPAKKSAPKPKATTKKTAGFLQNRGLHKILGLFFVFTSVVLLISFTSYLFTWTVDFDKLQSYHYSFWSLIVDTDVQVDNVMGRLGAWLAFLFITRWFGIISYVFVLFFFVLGVRLMSRLRLMNISKLSIFILLSVLWFSITLAFIFPEKPAFGLGGVVGYELSQWLMQLLGTLGEAFFLFFVLITYLTLKYNIPFRWSGPVKAWMIRRMEKQQERREAKGARNRPKTSGEDIYNTDEYSVDDEEEEETLANKPSSKPIPKSKDVPVEEDADDAPTATTVDFESVTPSAPKPKSKNEPVFEINQPIEPEEEKKTDDPEFDIVQPISPIPKAQPDDAEEIKHSGLEDPYDPRKDLPDFRFPDYTLLEAHDSTASEKVKTDELEANKNRIVETLNNYSIKIQKIKATIGPTVTLYEIVPAPGVRISKIKNLEDDIALSLAALGIRIIAPIPGRGTIGIEVPNSKPEVVSMRSVINSDKFRNSKYQLPIGLGKTISNEIFVFDLAKMPHLLMAGATGQGKSVGLNAIITSLLYTKHPAELKFVMVDPKKVELTLFSKIERHYLAKLPDSEEAIITDTTKVVQTLKSLVIEMDNRYELLKDAQVRNIKEYNPKFLARKLNPLEGHRYMPYIVLVVDEFADLIMTAGKDVEGPITRLAQLARAVGIHLIIATQRPSVNIITGTIKANFPARIAFRVTSKIDSRTILDSGGAEQLIGRGDMLLSTGNDLIRMQCAFVDTPEVDAITDFIGVQRAYPTALSLPEVDDEESTASKDFEADERDVLFEDAAHIIVQTQQGSTSLLQRKLKLGYNRAGRIIDQLEAAGIVGPFEGSKAREVRVANEMALEQFLKDLYNQNPGSDS